MKQSVLALVCLLTLQTAFTQTTPATATPAARDVVDKARAQAAKEGKNVFVMFHASWCGWCHKMDSSMHDPSCKPFFDASYVTVHITVQESKNKKDLENPGGEALMDSYGGNKQGLPYWAVVDKDGVVLANSKMMPPNAGSDTPGDNVGCPASAKEIAHFISVLKKTSKITPAQQAAIEKRFAKNEAH